MRKILKKNNIFAFILGAIIFGSIGVVSAYAIFANDIGYTPKDTTWEVDNVKDAIDDLYAKSSSGILDNTSFYLRVENYSSSRDSSSLLAFSKLSYYKKFKISNRTLNSYASYCTIYGWSLKQNKPIVLNDNEEYFIQSDNDDYQFNSIFIYTRSSSDGSQAQCQALIDLYN